MIKIAIIGDVHTAFDDADVAFFNQSDFDLLLFAGDLAHYRFLEGVKVAQKMSELEKTAVFIPGNHDTVTPMQMLAELKNWPILKRVSSIFHPFRIRKLQSSMAPVKMGGYQTFSFDIRGFEFDVITGRPFSWGENLMASPHYLKNKFGVSTVEDSIVKLKWCVDQAKSNNLIFLAHTGPFGLSNGRSDIWGIDYRRKEGDGGDIDLAEAIKHAQHQNKTIHAVVAGHMHHRLKGSGHRETERFENGIHFINPARVPRIFEQDGKKLHHFNALLIDHTHVSVETKHH